MSRVSFSRRRFLLTAAGTLATATTGCRVTQPPPIAPPATAPASTVAPPTPAAAPTPGHDVTVRTIAEAEKLALVSYTPAERTQIVASVDDHLELVRRCRALRVGADVAPAMVFDPVLPGEPVPARARPPRFGVRAIPTLPARDEDIAHAAVTTLAAWLRARRITSTRLTELYLARLRELGPRLECVAELTEDLAREQAAQADRELARGRVRSPVHGVPWGAKDLLDTRGIPTRWGAEPYAERVPERDAAVVARLHAAGAVLVAKLSLGALAYGDRWSGGRTRNPWNPEEGSSGSSAGAAAATAAGLVGFALGSETLGSIVSPSMRCGTTGLRPTFGRVARTGAMPLCWSLDKLGPIVRTVEDGALVLAVVNGADAGDPASRQVPFAFDARAPVRGLRVGYAKRWFDGADANDVDRAALAALRALGVELVEVELPDLPYRALLTALLAESAAAFEELTLSDRDDQLAWQDDDAWPNTFRRARFLSAVDLVKVDRFRREVMEVMRRVFDQVALVFSPTYAGSLLLITNFTGHPCLTLRAGFLELPTRTGFGPRPKDDSGPRHRVPHGVTLWGRLFDEGTLLRVGMELERSLAVWRERPPVG